MNTMDFYGAEWCPDCQRAKSYMQDNDINFNILKSINTSGLLTRKLGRKTLF